jgi:VIT1/CCC1 family predicted Fe2+/Mn2+ transporter
VSVSSQRDSEKSLLARGTARVAGDAGAELDELAAIYEAKGVSPETAAQVVAELTAP